MKKVKALVPSIKAEILKEKEEVVKDCLREMIVELDTAKRVVSELKEQYEKFLEMDIDELLLERKTIRALIER